jgi:putative hydrolase of the HAD superfamily
MAVRAVILDLGNVVIPLDFSRCDHRLREIGAPPLHVLALQIQSWGLVDRFERGAITPENFCHEVTASFGLNIDDGEFWDIWNAMYAAEPAIPEEFLEGLRRNVRLLLLSNTNPIHFEMVRRRYSVLSHFDDCIVSFQVGAMKPDARIYEAALARSGCLPDECFFVDDMPPFVSGARNHGIDAVQFESFEQLQDDLRARGIRW